MNRRSAVRLCALLAFLGLCWPRLAQAQIIPMCRYRSHGPALLPDPACTPGVDNPAVTQANIKETICKPGWTKTVRPPVSVTNKIKAEVMLAYGNTVPQVPALKNAQDVAKCVEHSNDPNCYELDHLESIEDGGDPSAKGNLWPQPYNGFGARRKDPAETWLKGRVCAGKMDLDEARMMLRTDWYAAYLYMQKMKQKAGRK